MRTTKDMRNTKCIIAVLLSFAIAISGLGVGMTGSPLGEKQVNASSVEKMQTRLVAETKEPVSLLESVSHVLYTEAPQDPSATEDSVISEPMVEVTTKQAVKIASLWEPVSDEDSETVDYSYVYFGEYPQSELSEEALTEEIIHGEYDENNDVIIENHKIRRFAKEDGSYAYYSYEPIRWRVIKINGYEAILQSDMILDCQIYNNMKAESWTDTSLRQWLNSFDSQEKGFKKTAFTTEELTSIAAKKCGAVRDKIYLLSGPQLYGIAGLGQPYQLKTKASDYAFARGVVKEGQSDYGSWWVRNQINYSYDMGSMAGYIDENGVRYQGMDFSNKPEMAAIPQDTEGIGVCPCIVLDLSVPKVWTTEEEMLSGVMPERGDISTCIETGKCGPDVTYRIEDNTLYISGTGRMYDYDESRISPFQGHQEVEKLVIEEGITFIGEYAFRAMPVLEEVIMSDSVKRIGEAAFYQCQSLQNVTFSQELEFIGTCAFENCIALTKAIIPDSVHTIRMGAFYDCRMLAKIHLPANLDTVNDFLCYNCKLTEVTVPGSAEYIGRKAFASMSSLKKVVLEEGVIGIFDDAFERCYNLETIVIPESLSSVTMNFAEGTAWRENIRAQGEMYIINNKLLNMEACSGEVVIPQEITDITLDCQWMEDITRLEIPKTVETIKFQGDSIDWENEQLHKIYVYENSIAHNLVSSMKYNSWFYVIRENGQIVKEIISRFENMSSRPGHNYVPVPSEPVSDDAVTGEAVTPQAVLLGDVDFDNQVTLGDAQYVLKMSLKIITGANEEKNAADMNRDGQVTLEDAQLVLKTALKIVSWNIQWLTLYPVPEQWEPFNKSYWDQDFERVVFESPQPPTDCEF